jgi:hypothetical protein
MTLTVRPLSYRESTDIGIDNFRIQKTLQNIANADDDTRNKQITALLEAVAAVQLKFFLTSIESVNIAEGSVTEKAHIEEWLRNTDSDTYQLIKSRFDDAKQKWVMPPQQVACNECGAKNSINITLDQSSFFG